MDTDDIAAQIAAIRDAESRYEPIGSFDSWDLRRLDVDSWDSERSSVQHLRQQVGPDAAREVMRQHLRAAAVDTGAIEGLYPADAGFTWSVATESISMTEAERDGGDNFRANFEAQLEALELVVDAATASLPVSEAFIRRLHEVACAGQPTQRVLTELGWRDQSLVRGVYKTQPNSPTLADGSVFAYAPVDRVPDEMHRLVSELRSEGFASAHPIAQASYAHHSFVRIHPFSDGNGRVARLLASIWLLRAASIPLWIPTDDRAEYLAALQEADRGSPMALASFFLDESLGLLREASIALRQRVDGALEAHRAELRSARGSLARALRETVAARFASSVHAWDATSANRLARPGGIEFDLDGEVPVVAWPPGRPARWLSIGIDWSASPESRFVLVSGPIEADPFGLTRLVRESFSERELNPRITSSARRRLDQIVNGLAQDVGG